MTFFLILLCIVAVLLSGLPVFAALALLSAGLMLLVDGRLGTVGELIFGSLDSYLLVAIPLFTLMAHVMIRGRVVDALFSTAHTILRALPGGLAVATVAACTVFAAISGSSVATALTIGAVAIPQMIRYGYKPTMAYGVVGGGGTLGILIPPSGPMVLYGFISDTSIGALFVAGIIPGLMMAGIFAVYCMLEASWANPPIPREPAPSLGEILTALRQSFWALSLPVFVLGGMYFGIVTATEAAAAGALVAILIAAFVYRAFGWRDLWHASLDAARTTAMLFMILAAAGLLGNVLTRMRVPIEMVELITRLGFGKFEFLLALMALIFVLGMFLETISIILITTPVVLPVMKSLNIDPIWYGILLTINLELALITPPVGMNLFAIKGITRASMGAIVRGIAPYVVLLLLGLALVMLFPAIALWLPGTMNFH